LRIKKQETHLILQEHDDNDDDYTLNIGQSLFDDSHRRSK